jgi:hypothetical protein
MDDTFLSNARTAAQKALDPSSNRVNILINNAGIITIPDTLPMAIDTLFGVQPSYPFLSFPKS